MAALGKINHHQYLAYSTAVAGQSTGSSEESQRAPSALRGLTHGPCLQSCVILPTASRMFKTVLSFCFEYHTELILSLKYFPQISIVLKCIINFILIIFMYIHNM